MKKLLYILFAITLFVSCAEDDNSNEPTQDYTSFSVEIESTNDFRNCVAGYYTPDGLCKKLGDLGNLTKGKVSPEIRVDIDTLQYIYIFYDLYFDNEFDRTARIDVPFNLLKNKKNKIVLKSFFGIPADKENQYLYPH